MQCELRADLVFTMHTHHPNTHTIVRARPPHLQHACTPAHATRTHMQHTAHSVQYNAVHMQYTCSTHHACVRAYFIAYRLACSFSDSAHVALVLPTQAFCVLYTQTKTRCGGVTYSPALPLRTGSGCSAKQRWRLV